MYFHLWHVGHTKIWESKESDCSNLKTIQNCTFSAQFLGSYCGTSSWGEGHSGPRGCQINLQKCTKKQAKWGNTTLNIAFPKTKHISMSDQKIDCRPFLHSWATGAEKQTAERPNNHLPENQRYPKLPPRYGGDLIPLSRVRLSPKMGFMWVSR